MLVDSITAAGVAVISNRSRVNASAAHAIPYATSKSSLISSNKHRYRWYYKALGRRDRRHRRRVSLSKDGRVPASLIMQFEEGQDTDWLRLNGYWRY